MEGQEAQRQGRARMAEDPRRRRHRDERNVGRPSGGGRVRREKDTCRRGVQRQGQLEPDEGERDRIHREP